MKNNLNIFLFFLCISIANANDSEENSIQWYEYNISPYHFIDGPRMGTGIIDPVKKVIIQTLPDYKHYFTTAAIPRMTMILSESPKNTCIVGTFVADEFQKTWLLTKPLYRESHAMIAMKQSTFERLSKPSELSLEALLSDGILVFGRAKDQYISPKLNSLIANYTQDNIVKISNHQTSLSLHKMLAFNRVDYIVSYPGEAGWLKETEFKEEYDDLVLVKIKDMESDPPDVYLACSSTAQGQIVVSKINDALTPRVIAKIHLQYMSWLPDYNSKLEFMTHQRQ